MATHPSTDENLGNRLRLGVVFGLILVCVCTLGFLLSLTFKWPGEPEPRPVARAIERPTHSTAWDVPQADPEKAAEFLRAQTQRPRQTAATQGVAEIDAVAAAQPTSSVPLLAPTNTLVNPVSTTPFPDVVPSRVSTFDGTGIIMGRVTLRGVLPPSPQITFDPTCGRLHPGPVFMPFYVVNPDGGLADVFVYLSGGVQGAPYLAPKQPVVVDQRGCMFTPYVLGAQTGQTVMVLNSDPLLHNVHAMPQARGNRESNHAMLPNQTPLKLGFNQPDVFVRLKCDVHPWMFAYLFVVDHPFFSVSDTGGNYVISNVPPGSYALEAVHRKTHPGGMGVTRNVTVEEGRVTRFDFAIDVLQSASN